MEMANEEREPVQIAGLPADVCPRCGCVMWANKSIVGDKEIVRYVKCRNGNCNATFMSSQPPAKLVREIVKVDENSNIGKPTLRLARQVG